MFGFFRLIAMMMLIAAPLSYAADPVTKNIEKLLAPYQSKSAPGVAVLVRRDGRTVFSLGYGVRDLRSRALITSGTDFRLASCTKQFTAMAVMLLIKDGKLRYDEALTEIFPEFPAYGKSITVHNLLTHTSGLPDYEELMDKASAAAGHELWSETHQIQDAEVLKLLESESKGKFNPGTSWSYSNSGYVVLGLVVAKISGISFPDFLRLRIFTPLKMKKTLAYVNGRNEVPNRAYGHSPEKDKFIETDQSSTSATLGDGGVYSNLDDLARWDDALIEHTLLSAADMQPAFVPFKLPDGTLPRWSSGSGDSDPLAGNPVDYGFGWFLDPFRGHKRMWHYGDTQGFKTAIDKFPEDKLTIVVLANRNDVDAPGLAEKIAELYFANH